jgi:acetyl esterase
MAKLPFPSAAGTPPLFRAPLLHARRKAGALAVDSFFRSIATLAKLHPKAAPDAHGVEVLRNRVYHADYGADGLFDLYRPVERHAPLKTLLYVHGGGFRILSKDTHWVMALAFARQGYAVFNVNYRLSTTAPFPAAIEDVCRAYRWVRANAATYGANPDHIVLAGESAGANLVTALTVALSMRRPEAYATRTFEEGATPRAVIPACGIFQVSDVARLWRRRTMSTFIADRLSEVERSYLGSSTRPAEDLAMADPLRVLESDAPLARPLPPFFLPVGTKDPLLDDTRRLAAALERRGAPVTARYYPGEVHAFHAFVWRPLARRCWADTYAFLQQQDA